MTYRLTADCSNQLSYYRRVVYILDNGYRFERCRFAREPAIVLHAITPLSCGTAMTEPISPAIFFNLDLGTVRAINNNVKLVSVNANLVTEIILSIAPIDLVLCFMTPEFAPYICDQKLHSNCSLIATADTSPIRAPHILLLGSVRCANRPTAHLS